MGEHLDTLKNVQRRAAYAAAKRGHVAGPFTTTTAQSALGDWLPARLSHCTECGGDIWALANGETSVLRLCRSRQD